MVNTAVAGSHPTEGKLVEQLSPVFLVCVGSQCMCHFTPNQHQFGQTRRSAGKIDRFSSLLSRAVRWTGRATAFALHTWPPST